jgi:hypothetical protein
MAKENPRVGLRPDRGRHGQSGPPALGSDCGQYSPPPWYSTGSQAETGDELERLYPCPHGGVGGDRLLPVEVLTLTGLITYYVLFFIHLESRRICLAGVTTHPDQEWMEQMARNVTMEDSGFLINRRYLLHDRDSKYCSSFRQVIEAGSVKTLALPPRSPNLNAYAERWVRSVKEECLAKLILLGEGSLRRALRHYEAHYHGYEPEGREFEAPPGAPLLQLFEFIVLSIDPLLCFELSDGRAEASLLQGRRGGR